MSRALKAFKASLNFRRKKDRGAFLVTLLSAIVSCKVRILKGEGPLGQIYHNGKHSGTQEHLEQKGAKEKAGELLKGPIIPIGNY
jgi:hypothetical protein